MKTFEDFGVALGGAPQQVNADDAVELAVATYKDLGLISDEAKALEAFGQAAAALGSNLPESVTSQPHDIVMVPKLGELSLDDLLTRYDELTGQHGNPPTSVWHELWDRYSAKELSQGQTAAIEARAVLLGGNNEYDEAGLYFTKPKQNLEEQRQSLKEAQKDHDSDTTSLSSLPIAGYMVRNAMQLERGEQLMDRPTYTRFVELDNKSVDGVSYVPDADSIDLGLVYLYGSRERADPDVGVRLSAGSKNLESQAS